MRDLLLFFGRILPRRDFAPAAAVGLTAVTTQLWSAWYYPRRCPVNLKKSNAIQGSATPLFKFLRGPASPDAKRRDAKHAPSSRGMS
jgi:hypothetical protein